MKKIFLISCCLFITVCCCFSQQDAQYSQYMFNQLSANPAYAGSRDALSSSLLYRDQWTGIQGAPNTGTFSIQTPLKSKKIGLGLEVVSDKLGPESSNSVLFDYAYRIPLSKGKLSFGLRMGIYDYVFDWSKMDYRDQNDALYQNNMDSRTSKITGTGDFGMYYYSRTFYCGLAATHLNRGKITDVAVGDTSARQYIHLFMTIGKAFQVGNTVINPSLMIKKVSNAPSEIDLNCNILLKERLWLGASYRSGYGMVFLTQYLISDKMKAGYSYDYGFNKIGTAGKGTHEIMIGYDIGVRGVKMITPRYM